MKDPIWNAYIKEAVLSDIDFKGDEDIHDLAKIEPRELGDEPEDLEVDDRLDDARKEIISQIERIDDIDLLHKISLYVAAKREKDLGDENEIGREFGPEELYDAPFSGKTDEEKWGYPGDR